MTEYFICPIHNVTKPREIKRSRNPHCFCGEEMILYHDTEIKTMATMQEYHNEQFLQFLEDLCVHIQLVGGVGNPQHVRKKSIEDLYKELRPNGIVIGFRNLRLRKKYQLSDQMKSEVLYEDREDETD